MFSPYLHENKLQIVQLQTYILYLLAGSKSSQAILKHIDPERVEATNVDIDPQVKLAVIDQVWPCYVSGKSIGYCVSPITY